MLNITLLDGKKLQFPGKVNGHEIAKTISPSLAKKALVIKVNDNFKQKRMKYNRKKITFHN